MSDALAAHRHEDAEGSGARRGGEEASGRGAVVLKLLAPQAAISLQTLHAETEALDNERSDREAQTELAHANRVTTMGQLAASIAHEVNQPIAAAMTNAEAALLWLGARPPALEEVRQALTRIVRDTNRAGNVIGRLRDFIKKAPPRQDCVDIQQAIREVIELTRSETLNNGVLVQTSLADGLPPVKGDRVQLQQVLLNLIVNAVQAMGTMEDGQRDLLISTTQIALNSVLVTVKDSGPGLDPTKLAHVFDPFYTTKPGGLGMGLSICRSIIEAHGGRLWASANVPRGAVFQFTLRSERDEAVGGESADQMPVG